MNNFVKSCCENQKLKNFVAKWKESTPSLPRWRQLPLKPGFDGLICKQSDRWLKKLTPLQDNYKPNSYAIQIQKLNKSDYTEHTDGILLSEREYGFLIKVLNYFKSGQKQKFFRQTFDSNNKIIIYKNGLIGGFDIFRIGTDFQFIRLTGREVSKLLRDYQQLDKFCEFGLDEVDHPVSINEMIDSGYLVFNELIV